MKDNPDNIFEKEFARYELVYITILTVILLGAWILSSDIFDPLFRSLSNNEHCYVVIGAAVVITVTAMKLFGKRFATFISKFWIKNKKNG